MKKYNLFKLMFSIIFLSAFAMAQTQQIGANKVVIGNKTSVDKAIEFNLGLGTANPKIKGNSATSKLQFSQDGVNFKDVGSGSGSGGAGINLLTESGFESGISVGWTNSGGSYSAITSGTNLLFQTTSAGFQPTASGQFFESTAIAVPVELQGQSCMVKISYKGADANVFLTALDGASVNITNNIIATLSTQSQKSVAKLYFTCPSSGSVKLRVQSTAAGVLGSYDQAILGESDFVQSKQASFIGEVTFGTQSHQVTQTALTDVLITGSKTYTGVSAPAGNRAGFTLSNVRAGRYVVKATGINLVTTNNSASNIKTKVYFASNDFATCGLLLGSPNQANITDGESGADFSCEFSVASDLSTKEVWMQVSSNSSLNPSAQVQFNVAASAKITVTFFPSGSDVVINSKCPNDIACENNFTAYIGASVGTTSQENLDWINGNCSKGGTGLYTCTYNSGIFTTPPNCSTQIIGGTNFIAVPTTNVVGSIQVTVRNASQVLTDGDFVLSCQKNLADFKARQNIQGFLATTVTSGQNNTRVEYASVESTCSASPCSIGFQSGGFASIVRNSIGNYTANFIAGTFSTKPACNITINTVGVNNFSTIDAGATSNSFLGFRTATITTTPALADSVFNITCMGQR